MSKSKAAGAATTPTDSQLIYQDRVNRVLNFIDEHLAEPLPIARLARIAHFSPFHFHRIFRIISGEPLHACIRRLRLERALALMRTQRRSSLTGIALDCGFASSSDFSRAFSQAYGFSPRRYSPENFAQNSKIRQELAAARGYGIGAPEKQRNPDRFRVRLVDRPAQKIAYVRIIGGYQPVKIMTEYERLLAWGRKVGVLPGAQLIGMSPDDPDVTPAHKYRFDWALVVPPHIMPSGCVSQGHIPASRFAVLPMRGSVHKELRAWQYLFREWLPRSGYVPATGPALEVYPRVPKVLNMKKLELQCCLPVQPLL